jgi:competence protein ComEC
MALPLWAASFASGITLALVCPRALALAALFVALALAAWRALRRSPALATAAAALALGVVAGLRALPGPEPEDDERPRALVAEVERGPDPFGERVHLLLRTISIDGQPWRQTVALSAARADGVAPGDRVRLQAALRAVRGLANPGLPDARISALGAGVDWYASLGSHDRLALERQGSVLGPRRVAWRLRRALDRAIVAGVSARAAALLRTLVLGERSEVDVRIEDGFRAAGATHVLSVSGLHLAAVAALLVLFVRRVVTAIPPLALRFDARALAALVALPAVGLYTLVTGEAVATERSAWMAAAALGASLVRRRGSTGAGIALAALAILACRPLLVLDVSFQLSFASVIALALFARRLAPGSEAEGWRARLLGWLRGFGAATLAAGLATGPLVAHHFGEITPASPLGNLLLVPLVELAVLPLGLGGALLGAFHPWAGWVPLRLAQLGATLALAVAEGFRRLAPVLLVRAPDAGETAALTVAAVALLAALAGLGGARAIWWKVALGAAALAAGSLGLRELRRRTSDEVRITFLDVGQGDAAVVEGPRGFTAVIDGGGSYDDSFDTGARVVEPYLRARGIVRLDLVALSHPHPDHLNGLMRVLARFPVAALWTSGDDGHNPRYLELRALARERGVPAPTPGTLARDGLLLAARGPWLDDRIAAPPGMSVNDASLVLRLSYRGRAVLFPGDLEEGGEGELVARAELAGGALASEVLKVPHHGSRTSSSAELLGAVGPNLAVISLGYHNRFHFPRPEVLERYRARGVRVLRTDRDGAVTVTIDGQGEWRATCARGCR